MKTLVAIPCMDTVPVGFMRSVISLKMCGEVQFTFAQGSLIYDARNKLANIAIDGGFDRMLWLDSDMEFGPDTFRYLNEDLDQGLDFVTGLYFTRKVPIKPVAYSAVYADSNGVPHADEIREWPNDRLFEIKACGFGMVLCTVDLMKRIRDKYHLPFSPAYGFGEDLSFCLRANQLGAKMYCDPRMPIGHIGQYTYSFNDYDMEALDGGRGDHAGHAENGPGAHD